MVGGRGMKLDYIKSLRIFGLCSIIVGVLHILISFFITPVFLAKYLSSDGILEMSSLLKISPLKFSVVSFGIFSIAFGALIFIYPSTINRFFDLIPLIGKRGERFRTRFFYISLCFAFFFIALMLGILFTQSGSGLSPDSLVYMNTAKNVYYGNGFYFDSGGSRYPLTFFPPLFTFSIATFMNLGFNEEQAARLIPIICFALLMFPIFFLAKALSNVYAGYIVCFMVLIFTPLLLVTSYAWTEMLYIFFSVLAILFLKKFAENASESKMLLISGFFITLAILTRYIGVTLLFVGLIVILVNSKSQLKKMVYQILLIGFMPVLLITPWLYRNIILTSNLSGIERAWNNEGTTIEPVRLLLNLNLTVGIILDDFFRVPLPELLSNKYINLLLNLIIIAISIILVVILKKLYSEKRKVLLEYLRKNYVLILYILVYLTTLIIMSAMWRFDKIATRLTSPIYPFLILLAVSFFFYAHKRIIRPSLKSFIFLITIVLFILFPILQTGNSIYFYYQYAKDGQDYNAPFWKNNQGINWAAINVPDDNTIYSDFSDVVEFRLRRSIKSLPRSGDDEAISDFFVKLKNEGNSYIISYNLRNYLRNDLQNDEILNMNKKYNMLDIVENSTEYTIFKTKDDP